MPSFSSKPAHELRATDHFILIDYYVRKIKEYRDKGDIPAAAEFAISAAQEMEQLRNALVAQAEEVKVGP